MHRTSDIRMSEDTCTHPRNACNECSRLLKLTNPVYQTGFAIVQYDDGQNAHPNPQKSAQVRFVLGLLGEAGIS